MAQEITTILPYPTYSRLVNAIIRLPEPDFWNLVSLRLNDSILLSSRRDRVEKIPDADQREFYTEDFLIEEIFLRLALTKIIQTEHNAADCGITVYKYYNQAFKLLKWIPVQKPTPQFIVDMSDLNIRIIAELKTLDEKGSQYVLKQAVGRIFENIDSRRYHLSIARNLEVVLKP